MKIHVWVPDYASSMGGIQAFSRFLIRAIRNCLPSADIRVLAKNDTSIPAPENCYGAEFKIFGWWAPWQRTAAFTAALIKNALLDRPDLIVSTHVNFSPVAAFLKRLSFIPFIAVGHGIEVWEIADRRIRNSLKQANQLLAVSRFTRERMALALGVDQNMIDLLPNTFDPQIFMPMVKPRFLLKQYNIMAEEPVILTIARLASAERYKGYDQVLKALPKVLSHFPQAKYVLGGRGPDRPRVERLVQELGLGDRVVLTGYVPDHELSAHYNLCDVFAMPSKGEGFGIVFLEALACGKPVITGNKDGSVDAVLDGKIGTLIDPDNIHQIASAIIEALTNRKELNGKFLREQVIEAYAYPKFAGKVRMILEPFISDNSLFATRPQPS
jgi:glycosyltransferase involved in cell wall biosynthesis